MKTVILFLYISPARAFTIIVFIHCNLKFSRCDFKSSAFLNRNNYIRNMKFTQPGRKVALSKSRRVTVKCYVAIARCFTARNTAESVQILCRAFKTPRFHFRARLTTTPHNIHLSRPRTDRSQTRETTLCTVNTFFVFTVSTIPTTDNQYEDKPVRETTITRSYDVTTNENRVHAGRSTLMRINCRKSAFVCRQAAPQTE